MTRASSGRVAAITWTLALVACHSEARPAPAPRDPAPSLSTCREQFAAGRLDAAAATCAAIGEPPTAELWLLRGEIAHARGRDDVALRHLSAAIAAGDRTAKPHYLSGMILRDKALFADACDAFAAATHADPHAVAAQAELAACRIHTGDPRAARSEYELCKRIATGGCPCEGPLAAAAFASNMLGTGLRYLDTWADDCPDDPDSFIARCRALAGAGRCAEAHAACATARAKGGDLATAEAAVAACR